MTGGSSYSFTSLLGRGKKVTVVYGTLMNSAGTPMSGVWIRITQGAVTASQQTGSDGTYVFYDGQACSGDGLDSCSAGTTSWTFANGNASSTLAILGDGATPGTYPSGKTTASVKSGSTTYQSFTFPAALSYAFTVAKSTAYSRDWKFGP